MKEGMTKHKYSLAKLVAHYYQYILKAKGREPEDRLLHSVKMWFNYIYSDIYITYAMNKLRYDQMSFVELDALYKNNPEFKEYRYPIQTQICICKSCNVGASSTSYDEILEQTKKFGKFICRDCERTVKSYTPNSKVFMDEAGYYRDEGVRPPGEKLLGFGGRLFLINIEGEVRLTNNLIHVSSVSPLLSKYYKHKINAGIIQVKNEEGVSSLVNEDQMRTLKGSKAFKILFK